MDGEKIFPHFFIKSLRLPCNFPLYGSLIGLPHATEKTALLEQLPAGSTLHDCAVLHDKDAIYIGDSGKPVCNHDDGFSSG